MPGPNAHVFHLTWKTLGLLIGPWNLSMNTVSIWIHMNMASGLCKTSLVSMAMFHLRLPQFPNLAPPHNGTHPAPQLLNFYPCNPTISALVLPQTLVWPSCPIWSRDFDQLLHRAPCLGSVFSISSCPLKHPPPLWSPDLWLCSANT